MSGRVDHEARIVGLLILFLALAFVWLAKCVG